MHSPVVYLRHLVPFIGDLESVVKHEKVHKDLVLRGDVRHRDELDGLVEVS